MSNEVNAVVESTTTVTRSPAVSQDTFIRAIFAGAKSGKTNAEVAESLGMKTQSFAVRLSNLRKNPPTEIVEQFAKAGKVFTVPKLTDGRKGRRGVSLANVGNDLLAQMAEFETAGENATGETESVGETA